MSVKKGCPEGRLACVLKDWVGLEETEKEKDWGKVVEVVASQA